MICFVKINQAKKLIISIGVLTAKNQFIPGFEKLQETWKKQETGKMLSISL